MKKPLVLLVLILSSSILAGKETSFPFFKGNAAYQRIIQISCFQNDCFFNAIRHAGIPINRIYLLRRLEEMREDVRWQTAVYFMVQQELANLGPAEDDAPLVHAPYDWLIEHLRGGAPMPFHAYREPWETQIPDLVDLLGEELNFDIRITRREQGETLTVMREFARPEDPAVQRVTLLYTDMGPVGHFDLVVDRDFPHFFERLYNTERRLGKGCQGQVYEVYSEKQRFACKVIDVKNSNQYALGERDITAAFSHPSIVSYVESFEHCLSGLMVIVLELIEGQTLKEFIDRNRRTRFTDSLILEIFTQILLGINQVHQQKTLHGDLKLENIMMRNDGCIKLCDFGFAESSPNIGHLTGSRRICGTYYYLAPEIIRREEHGQAVDIWALGVLLHVLSERQWPFQINGHINSLHNQILNLELPQLNNRSSELNSLRDSLLKKNPAERPTVRQILQLPFIRDALLRLLNYSIPEALKTIIRSQSE